MSSIRIIKGLPLSLLVGVSANTTPVNLNDTTWNTQIELKYQTAKGTSPFVLTKTPSGNGYLVEITGVQSAGLEHKGSGYVLIIRASKTDSSINIRNVFSVSVSEDV